MLLAPLVNIPKTTIYRAIYNLIKRENPTWDNGTVEKVLPTIMSSLGEEIQRGDATVNLTLTIDYYEVSHIVSWIKIILYYF